MFALNVSALLPFEEQKEAIFPRIHIGTNHEFFLAYSVVLWMNRCFPLLHHHPKYCSLPRLHHLLPIAGKKAVAYICRLALLVVLPVLDNKNHKIQDKYPVFKIQIQTQKSQNLGSVTYHLHILMGPAIPTVWYM